MTTSPNVPAVAMSRTVLSSGECREVLERMSFGHLAFVRRTHVDAIPIRFAVTGSWLYFGASAALQHEILQNRWILVAVTEALDPTHVTSVVARGACYSTEQTGSVTDDAVALRGIVRLRDNAPRGAARRPRTERRTETVFRMHVDELSGHTTLVESLAAASDPATRSLVRGSLGSDALTSGVAGA